MAHKDEILGFIKANLNHPSIKASKAAFAAKRPQERSSPLMSP